MDEANADVIAIDAPPAWAPQGRSRLTERLLAEMNLHAFNTPSAEHAGSNRFYAWMEAGFQVFEVAAAHGFQRYRAGDPKRTAMEVFPHASAAVLAGCLPPKGTTKKAWRARVLRAHGVATHELTTADRIDAALCALTGLLALDGQALRSRRPEGGSHRAPLGRLAGAPVPSGAPRGERRVHGPVVPGMRLRRAGLPRADPQRVRPGARREAQVHALASGEGRAGFDRGVAATGLDAPAGGAMSDERRFDTRAIHAGQEPEALYGSVNVPIYQTSTYAQDRRGLGQGLGLRAGREPHAGSLPAGAGLARGWRHLSRLLERSRRRDDVAAHAPPGRPRGARRRRVRGDAPVDGQGPRTLGTDAHDRRPHGPGGHPGRAPRRDPVPVDRDALEPLAQDRRHRGCLERRARRGRSGRRRQHVRDAGAAASARARCRRRGPQRHEVPRRAFRPDRRRAGHERRRAERSRGRSSSTPSAPYQDRWTRTSPSVASRRSASGWSATVRTP